MAPFVLAIVAIVIFGGVSVGVSPFCRCYVTLYSAGHGDPFDLCLDYPASVFPHRSFNWINRCFAELHYVFKQPDHDVQWAICEDLFKIVYPSWLTDVQYLLLASASVVGVGLMLFWFCAGARQRVVGRRLFLTRLGLSEGDPLVLRADAVLTRYGRDQAIDLIRLKSILRMHDRYAAHKAAKQRRKDYAKDMFA